MFQRVMLRIFNKYQNLIILPNYFHQLFHAMHIVSLCPVCGLSLIKLPFCFSVHGSCLLPLFVCFCVYLVLVFVVKYFVFFLVLQSSHWGSESE